MPNNFLLLDEPTNHLDADSREVLLQALISYEGTLCLVSHDREFVAPLVNQLLEIQGGQIIPLVISYDEYLSKKVQETRDRMKRPSKSNTLMGGTLNTKSAAAAIDDGDGSASHSEPTRSNKPSNNQVRNWQKEIAKIETEIAKLDQRQSELNSRLSSENFEQNSVLLRELIEEQTKNQTALDLKMTRWEELSGLLGN